MDFKEKKAFLDYLYYDVCKQAFDYKLCHLGGFPSKWKKYSEVCFDYEKPENKRFIIKANNREIFPHEIVLDLEKKEQLDPLLKRLNIHNLNYKVYSTGSRGYHIHLLFPELLHVWVENPQKIVEIKKGFIQIFGADLQKASLSNMIALENEKHWKSGKEKCLIPNQNE